MSVRDPRIKSTSTLFCQDSVFYVNILLFNYLNHPGKPFRHIGLIKGAVFDGLFDKYGHLEGGSGGIDYPCRISVDALGLRIHIFVRPPSPLIEKYHFEMFYPVVS